eukprot:scaffold201391_cov26-Tisochrysis_lutea.AAC.2
MCGPPALCSICAAVRAAFASDVCHAQKPKDSLKSQLPSRECACGCGLCATAQLAAASESSQACCAERRRVSTPTLRCCSRT